jgi:hypothetical protein
LNYFFQFAEIACATAFFNASLVHTAHQSQSSAAAVLFFYLKLSGRTPHESCSKRFYID